MAHMYKLFTMNSAIFHKKNRYCNFLFHWDFNNNLCFKGERRSNGCGTSGGWVIYDIIFIHWLPNSEQELVHLKRKLQSVLANQCVIQTSHRFLLFFGIKIEIKKYFSLLCVRIYSITEIHYSCCEYHWSLFQLLCIIYK